MSVQSGTLSALGGGIRGEETRPVGPLLHEVNEKLSALSERLHGSCAQIEAVLARAGVPLYPPEAPKAIDAPSNEDQLSKINERMVLISTHLLWLESLSNSLARLA